MSLAMAATDLYGTFLWADRDLEPEDMVWWVEKGWIFGLKSPYLQCYMNLYYLNPLSPLCTPFSHG